MKIFFNFYPFKRPNVLTSIKRVLFRIIQEYASIQPFNSIFMLEISSKLFKSKTLLQEYMYARICKQVRASPRHSSVGRRLSAREQQSTQTSRDKLKQ